MSHQNEGRCGTCGATIEGPIVKDGGRSRPLWRDQCRRKPAEVGKRCWQHGGPRKSDLTDTSPSDGAREDGRHG